MDYYRSITNLFLHSALTEENPFISTEGAINWVKERNEAIHVNVNRIPFAELQKWYFDKDKGALRHESGRFFSIEGIKVQTNWGKINEWEQPIINQPEVGYLGIITKEFDGVLYFLLQAKVEPGNVNNVQLSPTLQATRSNYSQVHSGRKPLYLDFFQNVKKENILLDQLQSEQGARFLKKRNRNMIIKAEGEVPEEEDFIWLTLGQIKRLISIDNLVNMDTRTVISGIPFGEYSESDHQNFFTDDSLINIPFLKSALDSENYKHSFDEIIMWLTNLKCTYDLDITPVSIFNTKNWMVDTHSIHHKENKFFKVIASRVEISNREVTSWYQPLIEPVEDGIIAFIYKEINDIPHFLVQAKLECGNFDILEMAPTVQCITGSYKQTQDIPYLDYILNADESQIKHDSLQSEEGGRFYREQNRSIIVEAGSDFNEEVPDNYIWVTINQLNTFLKFNNYLNIQVRSLISTFQFLK
jgi:oxidase EvaA